MIMTFRYYLQTWMAIIPCSYRYTPINFLVIINLNNLEQTYATVKKCFKHHNNAKKKILVLLTLDICKHHLIYSYNDWFHQGKVEFIHMSGPALLLATDQSQLTICFSLQSVLAVHFVLISWYRRDRSLPSN